MIGIHDDLQLPEGTTRSEFVKRTGLAAAGLAVGSLAGSWPVAGALGAGPSLKGKKVGVSMWVNAEVHQQIIRWARAQAALPGNGEKIGPVVDAGGDGVKQITQAEAFLTQGFDGVFVLNIQPEGWDPWGKRALAKGMTVVVLGPAFFKNSTQTVATPQSLAGTTLASLSAKWFKQKHGGKGEYGLLELTSVARLVARTASMKTTMAKLVPNVKLIGTAEAATAEDGAKAVASMLAAHPNMKAVLCFNDDAGIGAFRAASEAGKTGSDNFWIGGVDGTESAADALRKPDSIYQASISYLLTFAGVQAERDMETHMRGKPIPKARLWLPFVLTGKNATQYLDIIKDPLAPSVQWIYKKHTRIYKSVSALPV